MCLDISSSSGSEETLSLVRCRCCRNYKRVIKSDITAKKRCRLCVVVVVETLRYKYSVKTRNSRPLQHLFQLDPRESIEHFQGCLMLFTESVTQML